MKAQPSAGWLMLRRIAFAILALLALAFIIDVLFMRWGLTRVPGQVSPLWVYLTLLVNSGLCVYWSQLAIRSGAMTKKNKN